jgi:hypothetical protein
VITGRPACFEATPTEQFGERGVSSRRFKVDIPGHGGVIETFDCCGCGRSCFDTSRKWQAGGAAAGVRGLIAEEVAEVFPEW